MKYKKYLGLAGTMLALSGCSFFQESVYTLKEKEVTIQIHDKSFDPLDYVLKDEEPLSDQEKRSVKTSGAIDTSVLGDAIFKIPEYDLELQVHIVDEEPPTMSILGFEVKQGVVFTWNEENFDKLRPQLKDNYDSGELLKKTLRCDSVDTKETGKKPVTCYIEDSSGNQTSKTVDIEVVK